MRKYLLEFSGILVELEDGIYGRQLIYRKITQFIAIYYFIVPIKNQIKDTAHVFFVVLYQKLLLLVSAIQCYHPSIEDENEIKGQKLIF